MSNLPTQGRRWNIYVLRLYSWTDFPLAPNPMGYSVSVQGGTEESCKYSHLQAPLMPTRR